jgi:putative peptidoglycan lipid II flippase
VSVGQREAAGRPTSVARRLAHVAFGADEAGRRLRRTAVAFLVLYALARLLAFGRESVIAYLFGASRDTDSYVAATALPELVAGILLSGVIGYAIIPELLRRNSSGDEAGGSRFLQAAMWQVLVITGALALVTLAFADPITSLVAPGLDHHEHANAVLMLRLASPAIVFYGFTGLAAAVLNARQRFLAIPLSFLVGNLAGVAVLIALSTFGIVAAAVGYVASAAVFAVVQGWPARRVTQLPLLRPVWRGAELSALVSAGLAAIVVTSAPFLRGFVERILASTASHGDLAALGFATRVILVVGALIAISVGTVSFPTMAEHAIAENRPDLIQTVRRAAAIVVALSLPFALALAAAPSLTVRLLFQHGAFDRADTAVTSGVLRAFAFGLVAICLNEILLRALFALRAHRRALVAVLVNLVLNIGLDIWLLHATGVKGLGIGASIGVWLNAAALGIIFVRAVHDPRADAT